MDTATLKSQLRNLREWRDAYYNGSPLVTDAVYDDVEDQVRDAAKALPDSDKLKVEVEEFLAGVGAAIPEDDSVADDSKWDKANHTVPMGSLNKAQIEAEVREWNRKVLATLGLSEAPMIWSDKCDGISIALYYTDGDLKKAVTRGDGEVGEDITRNVLKMQGVIRKIKGLTGFVRGEIVLRKTDWQKYFPTYANPRNAASGIAKRHDGSGSEHLTVLHYQIIRFGGQAIPNKAAEFKILDALGAALPQWGVVKTQAEFEVVYQRYVDGDREALDYDIDGLVLEMFAPDHMETLGSHNLRPKGAIAYKFPHDKKVSTLRTIEWQVGNTGRVTPVAIFDAVKLVGATVTNASLHNLTNIDKLVSAIGQEYLFVGDQIIVSRRNDVIPYVEEVIDTDLGDNPTALEVPTHCPVCGTDLKRAGEFLVCPNTEECPAQVAGAIKTWVKKLGLKGVGTSLIDALCEQGILNDASDLYKLDEGELAEVRMDGRRVGGTATTVVDAIQGKKNLPLHIFVGSLNIPLCSRSTCKTIVDAGFDTLEKMQDATVTTLAAIPGMGEGRARSFVAGISGREDLIDSLMTNGVTIEAPASGPLLGQSFCMTGFRDPDMGDAIEAQGGTLKLGVGKTLTTLVAKDPKSTSGKAQKARSYGVEVIGIEDMWTRLGGRP